MGFGGFKWTYYASGGVPARGYLKSANPTSQWRAELGVSVEQQYEKVVPATQ